MKRNKIKKLNATIVAGALAAVVAGGAAGALLAKKKEVNPEAANIAYATTIAEYGIDESKIGNGETYYVAPDGTRDNLDSSSPQNPTNLVTLLTMEGKLQPGDKVVVAPGEYIINLPIRAYSHGDPAKGYITVINEQRDDGEKAVLNFSGMTFDGNHRGVQIDGDYWYWYGVDICGAGDNGMYIGGSYNIVENCEFYNNRDTGLQLGRSYSEYNDIRQWPSYNLIKNCTSYNNYDNETYGENADGFAAKLTVGYGNIFDGCIAYRNSDDGWDLYAKADSGNIGAVIIYNCVAFENGYIGETQAQFNAKCGYVEADGKTWHPTYNTKYDEPITESYMTRDGDGNGFKLGGSVMEGDVFLYNCMSFNNRMHGVTDNSNPGVLSVANVTSYNNAALIDNDPESPNFGNIDLDKIATGSEDSCNNIDLSRQTYSYNHMSRIVSVSNGDQNLGSDRYRGTSEYCKYYTTSGSMYIEDVVDSSSFSEAYAVKGTPGDTISADIFAAVPSVDVLNGKGNNTVHAQYRNDDGTVNMHDILRIVDYGPLFGESNKIGADLAKSNWDEYTHYTYFNATNASSKTEAILKSAQATLDLNTNKGATFQDFDLTTVLEDVSITWTSSDESAIKIEEGVESISKTKDARAIVYRVEGEDKTVTLTATVALLSDPTQTVQRSFEVTVKADIPTIGDAIFEGVEDGVIIFDRYAHFDEPDFGVLNAADYNGKILDPDKYEVKSKYTYAETKGEAPVEIKKFTSSVSGVYTITKTVKMKTNTQSREYSYMIYVAGVAANIGFVDDKSSVVVNQHGYIISGEVSSAVGSIYSLSSDTPIADLTPQQLMEEGTKYDFRGEKISFQFANANTGKYYIYYLLGNANGVATTAVKTVEVNTVEIDNATKFKDMLKNSDPATIYLLTADIDLSAEKNWSSSVTAQKKSFTGLLNGMGHTISGLTVTGTDNEMGAMIYRLDGGTIENVKFKNITITGKEKTGIIATSYGGFLYNIAMENVRATGTVRIGGLVGQVMAGENHIDQISFINDKTYSLATNVKEIDFDGKTFYVKSGNDYVKATKFEQGTEYYVLDYDITGDRIGAIVGYIQASTANDYNVVYISNCYVDGVFGSGIETYAGSIVGRYDDRNKKDFLQISNCFSQSILRANKYQGGIIGGQSGAGSLRMDHCVFIGELYYAADLAHKLTTSLKNCSGIMGYFSQYGDTEISRCYAPIQEYNSNYDVDFEVFLTGRVKEESFWRDRVGYDFETRWTLLGSGNDMAAPYIIINFLEG